MKAWWLTIASVATALMFACEAGATEDAAAFKALAKKKGCFNCHRMDKPVLGPSLKDIGRKYSKDASAPGNLFGIIRTGMAAVPPLIMKLAMPVPSPQSSGETTSHSTSLAKDASQVAGYPASGRGGERIAARVSR